MGLAGAQGVAKRQAAGIDHGMDLGGQSASGTTNATIRCPFLRVFGERDATRSHAAREIQNPAAKALQFFFR